MNDNIARGRIASSLQDCSLNSGGSPITKNKRHQQRQAISSTCTRGIAAKAGNILEFSYNSENLALNPAIIGSDQWVGNRQRGSIVDNKTANPHETFLRLWMKHEPELRAFVRSCCPRAQEVDDVMQEVSIAALRKFPTLDDHAAFGPWSCLVARYEILSARRKHARDRLVLSEDILLMLADEGAHEMELRKEQSPDQASPSCLTIDVNLQSPPTPREQPSGKWQNECEKRKALSIKCWQESECNYGVVSIANCQESQHDEKQHFRER